MDRPEQEFRVLKELSRPHQTMRFLGMDLRMGQFAILAGSLLPLAVAYRLGFFSLLGLSPLQVAGFAVPFIAGALLFAFGGWGGKDFSFIAAKKLQSATRARRLVWKRRPPHSAMWLRDAVQRYLPAERFYWDTLKTNNGSYVRILEVEADSLSLASEEQKERVRARLAQAYASFDFPLVEYTRSRPSSMGTYLSSLREELEREVAELRREGSDEEASKRQSFGEQHIEHVQEMVADRSAYERTSYLILTHNPRATETPNSLSEQVKGLPAPFFSVFGRPSKRLVKRDQEEANSAHRKLSERVDIVTEAYGRLGLNLRPLGEQEALAFIREEAGSNNLSGVTDESGSPAEDKAPVRLGPVVALTDHQYDKLSEKALGKRIEAAEEFRADGGGEAPHVVGLGELTINDRIAPDAVRVHADHIQVGSTFQRTLYVYDLPERVRFGILQSLVEMKEKITVVKYIQPISKKESLEILGRKESQLRAAERITASGNLLARHAKETARKNAEFARAEVAHDRERYYELTILIQCEADSLEELNALTDRVRTKLDEMYAYTHVAREEMWEGYVSRLPLGELHLELKYCSSGILTAALSCFSTFSSLQLNHKRGCYGGPTRTRVPP